MADRHALGLIGLLLGVATIVVTMVGAVVVNDHLSGKLRADDRVGAVSLPAAGH
jgi:hypothetical protein